jgi:hypothetical protein
VVSGEPVDLGSADGAARARDHADADAGKPVADEPTDTRVEREPQQDPVR